MRELEGKVKEISRNPEDKYKEMGIMRGRKGELYGNAKSSRRTRERDGRKK